MVNGDGDDGDGACCCYVVVIDLDLGGYTAEEESTQASKGARTDPRCQLGANVVC